MKTFTDVTAIEEEGHYWWCPEFLVHNKEDHLPNAWQVIYVIPGRVVRYGVFKGPLTPPESAK